MTRSDWLTFKEIDLRNGWPKGAAFRRFKRALDRLAEGQDFVRLDASSCAREVEELRTAGRLYASTVHAVLISRQVATALERCESQWIDGLG